MNHTVEIAICSASLADVYESEGQFEAAERELEAALDHEPDPELRAKLLSDLLHVELSLRNEEKAGSVFKEAHQIARKHHLSDIIIDIHMRVGDYNWRQDLEAKRDALRAYVAAIVVVLSMPDLEALPKVVGHVVTNLTNPHHALKDGEFESLIQGLKEEFPTLTDGNHKVSAIVLWPFETARRLLPFVGDQKRCLAELEKATKEGFL